MLKVIGYKRVDYVSKKTGKPVKGHELYCTYQSKSVVGEKPAENIYLSDFICERSGIVLTPDFVGKMVDFRYNHFHQIEEIIVE